MKYLGAISDPKDFVNKEYVDGKISNLSAQSLVVISSTPPESLNKIWINGTSMLFYNEILGEWVPFAITQDASPTVEENSYAGDEISSVTKYTTTDSSATLDGVFKLDIETY